MAGTANEDRVENIWKITRSLSITCATLMWRDDMNANVLLSWWRHEMGTFSALLAIVHGIHRSPVNSPHKGQWHGALMCFDLRLNKQLSKQSWGWWFETPSHPLWCHCNVCWMIMFFYKYRKIGRCFTCYCMGIPKRHYLCIIEEKHGLIELKSFPRECRTSKSYIPFDPGIGLMDLYQIHSVE